MQRLYRFAFVPLLVSLTTASALAVPGDANRDGYITEADVVAALKLAGGLVSGTTATFNRAAADVDGAPGITVHDAALIARMRREPSTAPAATLTDTLTSVTANVTRNYTLPAAYRLTGKVAPMPGNRGFDAILAFSTAGNPSVLTMSEEPVYPDTGRAYGALLRTGTHKVRVSANSYWYDWATETSFGYSISMPASPSSFTVTKDAVQDFGWGSPPVPVQITGTFLTTNARILDAWLDAVEGTYAGSSGLARLQGGDYSVVCPPGRARFQLSINNKEHAGPSTQVDYREDIEVVAGTPFTKNLSIGNLWWVEGTVSVPGNLAVSHVTAAVEHGWGVYRSSSDYRMNEGRFGFSLPVGTATATLVLEREQVGKNLLSRARDLTFEVASHNQMDVELALPAYPEANLTFSGTVHGPDGKVVPHVEVQAVSTAPLQNGWNMVSSTYTDDFGRYSLALALGSYRVDVGSTEMSVPPPPF